MLAAFMVDDITNLISIDFRNFSFARIKKDRLRSGRPVGFNELHMNLEQYDLLGKFLVEARPEIDKIISRHVEPDACDMELMDVRREDVGYRNIEVSIELDEKTSLVKDWRYKVSFLTKDKERENNPGMRLGDTFYTRAQVREFS